MLATDNLGSDAGIPVNNLAAAPGRLIVDRAIRKASRRILPFLFACFVVFYLGPRQSTASLGCNSCMT
ncbi:MAG: hypothetical protein WDN49_05845 [Acetobacteraceae bacterium]